MSKDEALSAENRALIERVRQWQPGYPVFPADINAILNAAREEGRSTPGVEEALREIREIVAAADANDRPPGELYDVRLDHLKAILSLLSPGGGGGARSETQTDGGGEP